jgi:hypothetical protein
MKLVFSMISTAQTVASAWSLAASTSTFSNDAHRLSVRATRAQIFVALAKVALADVHRVVEVEAWLGRLGPLEAVKSL